MAPKAMSAKQQIIRRRRRQVAALTVRRLTIGEIAEAIGASIATVKRDARANADELQRELARETGIASVARGILARSAGRDRELWAVIQRSMERREGDKVVQLEDRGAILTAIRELRQNQKDELAMLQSLGLIYKTPERVAVDMRVMTMLSNLPDAALRRLANASEAEFTQLVEDVLGPVAPDLALADAPSR